MSLEDIWKKQAELNRRAGYDTELIGKRLIEALSTVTEECDPDTRLHGPRFQSLSRALLTSGRVLNEYCNAMFSEVQELRDCTSWKHWYAEAKSGMQFVLRRTEVQNARVEVIDMLFFWVSMAQALGMTHEDVFRMYEAKLGINHKRQDEGRSQEEHASHESENTEVV